MATLKHHVLPDPGNGWQITRSDTDEPYGHFNTKEEAIEIAKQLSKEEQSQLVIHDESGRIVEEIPTSTYPYEVPVHTEES